MARYKQQYWAYCTYASNEGWRARGFVLASSKAEAEKKARKRVVTERRRVAREFKMSLGDLGPLPSRGTYRVRVWRDPHKSCAPAAKHYQERRTA